MNKRPLTPAEQARVDEHVAASRAFAAAADAAIAGHYTPLPSNYEDVIAFHRKFELPKGPKPGALIASVGREIARQRIRHLREEVDEYERAVLAGDGVKEADALVDLVYVALGCAAMCQFPWSPLWDAVHDANMAKEQTGAREKQGIRKPEGWEPPEQKERDILAYVGAAV